MIIIMTSYIQNYGFTKTMINDNNKIKEKAIEWNGKYDGNIANINMGINDNGDTQFVSMQLTKDELMNLLGVQTVNIPLEKRLVNDFYGEGIALEGALTKRKHKSRKHRRHNSRKHNSRKHRRTIKR